MPKPTYKAADFSKPKVAGLAVHNAKLARIKAQHISEERQDSFRVSPETHQYVLWGAVADCSLICLGSATIAADFNALIRKTNLAALASKYSDVIGFVTCSVGWSKNRGQANYTTINVPPVKGR